MYNYNTYACRGLEAKSRGGEMKGMKNMGKG
jgi:hypothetical protein